MFYGWKKDRPDIRDYKFNVSAPITYPTKIDNRPKDCPVYDQGQLGSCTANAALSAFRFVHMKEGKGDFDGSRLAQYYWSRALEGTTSQDAGAEIRDAVKVLNLTGIAPEKDWPYIVENFAVAPPAIALQEAKNNVALRYESVPLTKDAICRAVATNGHVIIGISVYESFESATVARTGVVPMPNIKKEQLLGGHAVTVVGYDLTSKVPRAIVKNSWGTSWGQKGYFTIPFSYLTNVNLASDFWTLSIVQ